MLFVKRSHHQKQQQQQQQQQKQQQQKTTSIDRWSFPDLKRPEITPQQHMADYVVHLNW